MADDHRFRSNPPPHGQGWPAKPAPGPGDSASRNKANDPLAELARLIGQTDPFGELQQGAPRAPSARPPQAAPSRQAAPSDPYGSPLHFSGFNAPRMPHAQPAYDSAAFGASEPHETDHASEGYYEEPAHGRHGEEHYDDYEERPRRRWLKVAVAAVVLIAIGGGGVYGYRTLFKGGLSGPPPVIKANTAPTKMAAPATADASNKQIYDRVGEASAQGERVVSREEKPVDVKDTSRPAPRVVFPGLQPASPETVSAPLATDPGGPDAASAEPKRIRTVQIRPDGTGSTAAPPPAQRTASAAPQTPPAQGNAPLSLSPQAATAEASAARPIVPAMPRPPVAAPATRLAAVPLATQVAAGSYTVQISSQRSESEAQASFRSLQAKYPNLLGDQQPIIRRADLGEKGIYFRTMVGPFASVDEASKFCGSLKSAGAQCVVQRN